MLGHKGIIEKLLREQSKLLVKKQEIRDAQDEENSRIETSIREAENRAYRLKQIADGKIATIDRLLKKNQEQMALESRYYNTLVSQSGSDCPNKTLKK